MPDTNMHNGSGNQDDTPTSRILIYMLSVALASSGGAIGVQQLFGVPGNGELKELVESLRGLPAIVHALKTDPLARPGAWTPEMAAKQSSALQGYVRDRERVIEGRHQDDIKDIREKLAVLLQELAGNKAILQAYDLRISRSTVDIDRLDEIMRSHGEWQEHPGAASRLKDHDRRLDVIERRKIGQNR